MPARFRAVVTDYAWPDLAVEEAILREAEAELVAVDYPGHDAQYEAALAGLARDADAIMTCWARVSGDVIRSAGRLRVVARYGIGVDNIDVAAATQRGIPVVNVPDYCVEEVSDHALALLLACARRVAWFHLRTKSGEYDLQAAGPMRRLSGQVLGIVGLGRIGRRLAAKARAIGMGVLATRASAQATRTGGLSAGVCGPGSARDDGGSGVEMLPLERLLEQSDFVSLHLPLTAETRHLIGRGELARMKPSAYLINTSRGGLVDHAALAEALAGNRIAGAALDVFEPEPPDLSQALFRDERVIVTPHAAFASQESIEELRRRTAEQVAAVLQGLRPAHVANPEVMGGG